MQTLPFTCMKERKIPTFPRSFHTRKACRRCADAGESVGSLSLWRLPHTGGTHAAWSLHVCACGSPNSASDRSTLRIPSTETVSLCASSHYELAHCGWVCASGECTWEKMQHHIHCTRVVWHHCVEACVSSRRRFQRKLCCTVCKSAGESQCACCWCVESGWTWWCRTHSTFYRCKVSGRSVSSCGSSACKGERRLCCRCCIQRVFLSVNTVLDHLPIQGHC